MIVSMKMRLNRSREKFSECWSGLLLLVNPGCGVGGGGRGQVGGGTSGRRDKWEEGQVGEGSVTLIG